MSPPFLTRTHGSPRRSLRKWLKIREELEINFNRSYVCVGEGDWGKVGDCGNNVIKILTVTIWGLVDLELPPQPQWKSLGTGVPIDWD